ncbi:unnamed protein product [Camellia sinensis]
MESLVVDGMVCSRRIWDKLPGFCCLLGPRTSEEEEEDERGQREKERREHPFESGKFPEIIKKTKQTGMKRSS